MYKEDLVLNNLQWLVCHKTKLNHIYKQADPKFLKVSYSDTRPNKGIIKCHINNYLCLPDISTKMKKNSFFSFSTFSFHLFLLSFIFQLSLSSNFFFSFPSSSFFFPFISYPPTSLSSSSSFFSVPSYDFINDWFFQVLLPFLLLLLILLLLLLFLLLCSKLKFYKWLIFSHPTPFPSSPTSSLPLPLSLPYLHPLPSSLFQFMTL